MGSRLIVESLGSEAILREGATADDIAFVEQFANASRRCEVLAWRAMVRRELGRDVRIFYDEYGAPNVALDNIYISISHSRNIAALLISDSPCAVDIEHTDRNFLRVAPKYLSVEEQALAEKYNLYAEMWSAKEALYKYYHKGSLDLVKHISIEEYIPNHNTLIATLLGSEPIEVKIENNGSYVVASIAR